MNSEEKSIEIIKNFLTEVLGETLENGKISRKQIDRLFNYCLIKHAYTENQYIIVKGTYGSISNYYEKENTKDVFITNDRVKGDADRIPISYSIYYLLWKDILDLESNQLNGKANTKCEEIEFNGDTLNTRDFILSVDNKYLFDMCKDIDKNEILETVDLVEDFRIKYETLGNFMPMPEGLNQKRGKPLQDRFDMYLYEVKKFYENEYNYFGKLETLGEELKRKENYFKGFGSFKNYIEQNYLQDFVESDYTIKDLSINSEEEAHKQDENNIQEIKTCKQVKNYIKNAKDIIKNRAEKMKKRLCEILLVEEEDIEMTKKPIVKKSKGQSIDTEYCVIDIESTGLSFTEDKIIEVGIVKLKNGKIIDTFECFVNPEQQISDLISDITKITNEVVKDAETIDKVMPKMLEFMKGTVLVAHNADFIIGFIKYNCRQLGLLFDFTYIDTLPLSKAVFPNLSKYKLSAITEKLDIKLEADYSILDGVKALAEVFNEMIKIVNANSIDAFEEFYKDYILNKVKELLKEEMQSVSYAVYIKSLEIESIVGNKIILIASSQIQKDGVETRLKELVLLAFNNVMKQNCEIEIKLKK